MRRLPLFALLSALLLPAPDALAQHHDGVAERQYRATILRAVDSLFERMYVLPDAATAHAAAFRKLVATGRYDTCADARAFARLVTADLLGLTGDGHIQLRVIAAGGAGEPPRGGLFHPVRYSRLRLKENSGFTRLEWLEGNIGLLECRRFYHLSEAKEMAIAAMKFLSMAQAIIIDIRENGGGSGDFLSSFFLEHPTQLNSQYSRTEGTLAQSWTDPDPGAERLTTVPLFLLTSRKTFSAAESFAYDLQARRRATLIGEPTGGGAHSYDLVTIDDQFEFAIPTMRAINPVTGGNWEGTGVIPEIRVPAAQAMDTALVLARRAAAEYGRQQSQRQQVLIDAMERHLEQAEDSYRANRLAEGAAAIDSLVVVGKQARLITEFFFSVLAYNYVAKEDEQLQYALLRKNIELNPGSPTVYEYLASACIARGTIDGAIEAYTALLRVHPDNQNAASMVSQLQQRKEKQ
jgi:tetratricopeptide (TPR) repeat protein